MHFHTSAKRGAEPVNFRRSEATVMVTVASMTSAGRNQPWQGGGILFISELVNRPVGLRMEG